MVKYIYSLNNILKNKIKLGLKTQNIKKINRLNNLKLK